MISKNIVISIFSILTLLFVSSCNERKPRFPIKVRTGVDYTGSIELSKRINQKEEKRLRKYLEIQDIDFDRSSFGFLYHIEKNRNPLIASGDIVKYSFIVENLNGKVFYQKQTKTLIVDHQEEIKGIHEGLKLMSEGAKATFIFPSHQAYGFHGDEKKIKTNTPLIYKVSVLKVLKKIVEPIVVDSTKVDN